MRGEFKKKEKGKQMYGGSLTGSSSYAPEEYGNCIS